ncbi:heavy metal translocating P-type ATPase [Herbaspirillum sp. HC18]|nr:heavy metal translocating P-type ATPase [Herbaspirillum sp. HC18]
MTSCSNDACGCSGDAPVMERTVARVLTLRIDKMDCPTEEMLIRKKLEAMPGVDQLEFNLMQRRLLVQHQLDDTAPIVGAVNALGMEALVEDKIGEATQRVVFSIDNMDCPTEEALIRNKLASMAGIATLDFNLVQRKLAVSHTLNDAAPIQQALRAIGMDATVVVPAATPAQEVSRPAMQYRQRWMMTIAGLSAAASEIVAFVTGNETSLVVIGLALLAIATSGFHTYKKGWIALKNRNLNINALMSIAVTGAVFIGQWPEAAMVMFLFALAELIEVLSLDRARNAIRGLMAMTPEKARVQLGNGSWTDIEATQVALDNRVRVGPGERIPLDGEVVAGQSVVNQAPITGESIPVAKTVGDPVFAGTINETGSFEFRVTAEANHSTIARIIHAVEEAQGSRAPTQRFVDQFAKVYTPAVFTVALLTAIAPPLLFGQPWTDWIYKALVLLVIACPCALVISTPVTIVSGLAAAARRGILIKGGIYLEQGRLLKSLALDKTGTITQGKPAVTEFVPLVPGDTAALPLAASLAARSDHPVSSAVSAYWESNAESHASGFALSDVADFAAVTGRGVKGRVGGRWFYLGNHRLIEELGICNAQTESVLFRLESEGKTAVVLCDETTPLAVVGVADTVRDTSRHAIAELHALGIRTVMLTGDNQKTASVIAQDVGIDDARGNLLPEDKLAAVERELATHNVVGMVGDGINDAPALAKASIGFAMGAAGTDTAIETADVALMDDDLRKIPQFIRLSRRAGLILKQNIALALGIKGIFFVLAVGGEASLWMAVFADMGTSLIVVANGLRLLNVSKQEK